METPIETTLICRLQCICSIHQLQLRRLTALEAGFAGVCWLIALGDIGDSFVLQSKATSVSKFGSLKLFQTNKHTNTQTNTQPTKHTNKQTMYIYIYIYIYTSKQQCIYIYIYIYMEIDTQTNKQCIYLALLVNSSSKSLQEDARTPVATSVRIKWNGHRDRTSEHIKWCSYCYWSSSAPLRSSRPHPQHSLPAAHHPHRSRCVPDPNSCWQFAKVDALKMWWVDGLEHCIWWSLLPTKSCPP